MTVTTTNVRNVLTGNGVATAFAFTFRFLSASTVQVFRNMPGATPALVSTSAYTLTPGVGNVGGTVTFTTAPANTEIITIQRTVPLTQSVDINNEDGFFPDVVEGGLDAATLGIQQIGDGVAASIRGPSVEGQLSELPSSAARAGKLMGFDGTGQPTVFNSPPAGTLALASQAAAEAGTNNTDYISPLRNRQAWVDWWGDDWSHNAKYYGVLPNGADTSPAMAAYWSVALASGMPMFIPPGEYNFTTHLVLNASTARQTGIRMQGAGLGRTRFNSTVTSGIAFHIYADLDWYDFTIKDMAFTGNTPAVLCAIGQNSFVDPLNVAVFENVGWFNPHDNNSAVALRLNYVVNSVFTNCRANCLATGARTVPSTTSNSIGTGSRTFTIATSLPFRATTPVRITSRADPANRIMNGTVTSYDSGTGALVVNVTSVTGSGTYTDWDVYVAGYNRGTALEARQIAFNCFNSGSYANGQYGIRFKDGFSFGNSWVSTDIENVDVCVDTANSSSGNNTFVGGQFSLWEVAAFQTTGGGLSTNAITLLNPNLGDDDADPVIDPGAFGGIRLIDGTAVATPAFPASGASVANITGKRVAVTVWGGTVTNVLAAGTNYAMASGTFILPHATSIVLTYTGTPSWTWRALE